MSERPHLLGMRPDDLVAALADRGTACPPEDARRLIAHVVSRGGADLMPRVPVRREVRIAVESHFRWEPLEVVERVRDDFDAFEKYLFKLHDGAFVEAVRIPLEKPGRFSVCLSTQVGCAMACTFCATGKLGLTRNLEAWEIVGQWRAIANDLAAERPDARISGAVFMGQGEPFHNYDAVIQTARVLQDPCGGCIASEAITVSTVGLVPQIRRFAREKQPYKLIVSLHSAIRTKRAELLPVAGRTDFDALKDALREVWDYAGDRVTLAWTLIGGVNHGQDEVDALIAEFAGLPIRVNLIDLNRWDEKDGQRRATDEERRELVGKLHAAGIATIRRYSGGQNRQAACGMLASTRQQSGSGPVTPS